jgi:hypothetical protein
VIENLPHRIELLRVKDGGKWYNPPKQHRNIKLAGAAPFDVATLGVEYYKQFVTEAEERIFEKV